MSKLLTEDTMLNAMKQFLDDCDADEFCRIAEEMFGGKFTPLLVDDKKPLCYTLEVNENYCGEFDDVDE